MNATGSKTDVPSMPDELETLTPVDAAKAELKRDFPDWNIVRSSKGRWWAFLAPDRRKSRPDVKDVDLDADTATELHTKLTAAES